eukprot:8308839-Pyramimonas_sp.AAC.1
MGYANHELQTVNDARSKGLLKQLMDNPSMLATSAEQSASEATARCSAELQPLREAQGDAAPSSSCLMAERPG